MLKHKLSEETIEYQKLARDFSTRHLRKGHGAESSEFPLDELKQAWESGLLNMAVPEAFGGLGLSTLEKCVIAEELAWGEAGIAGSIEGSDMAQRFVLEAGNDEQKNAYLAPLIEEAALAGYGMGRGKQNRLFYRVDNGEYFLNGKHDAIINGGVAQWYLVRAEEDRREQGEGEGQSAYFIVPSGEDGLEFEERICSLGRKSQVISKARFEEVMVPANGLLYKGDSGDSLYNRVLAHCYPLFAAGLVGVARSAMEHALRYARERHTFGKEIASYQGISFIIADMAKDLESARLMVYQAATLADLGLPSMSEAICARAFAQDMALRVTTDAVQVFGGYGFSKEYPVEKLMRDARVGGLIEGTSDEAKIALGRQLVASV